MPAIATCLWFNGNAEDAAELYTSLFPDSRVHKVVPAAADNPSTRAGDVLTVEFSLAGNTFIGLNGGPDFPFTEAISFVIECEDQHEVDHYWDALIQGGGQQGPCGWLKDRFGVSWQVVPRQLNEMLESPDRDAAARAMKAMLDMKKIDVQELRAAYEGVSAQTAAP